MKREVEPQLLVVPGHAIEVTRDHFTPRCIGKALGWTHDQINQPDNIQLLSIKRHRLKDQTTPWELQCVLQRGGAKTLWEHHNENIVLRRGNPFAS